MTFDVVAAWLMFGVIVVALLVLVIGALALHADPHDDWNS